MAAREIDGLRRYIFSLEERIDKLENILKKQIYQYDRDESEKEAIFREEDGLEDW